ncbi:hypothetical protein ACS0TY_013831 [Phlomoides rotata]
MGFENPIHDTDSVQHLGEDEEELVIGFENLDVSPGDNQLCLVGRFISEQPTNFNLLNSSITGVWRPQKGVNIRNIGEATIWEDTTLGFSQQAMLLGTVWRAFMWIRVEIDVGEPLKTGKKIRIGCGDVTWVKFNSEMGCMDQGYRSTGPIERREKWLRDDSVMTTDSPSQAQEDVAILAASPIAGKSVSSGGGDQEAALIVNNSKGKSVVTDGGTSKSIEQSHSF